ncbi:MAG: Gfo/Idh/MocA family oxidoreductase, partial [Clostridiales bacterium]|nr:Gfo/Idh/MocA family oxidoreductase [Clostridiales bacterium]
GNIARSMSAAIQGMQGEVVPHAIASRSLEKSSAMAEKFGFAHSYGSYEELVQDGDVDLIYIATPHSHHYDHAKLCLEHGKHVLCEKAFTANAAQAEELIALARERGLFLGEAMWTRFQPFVSKVQAVIADGEIGRVRRVEACFGSPLQRVERCTNPALAGGALLDIGIYPLTFAAVFLGTEIRSIKSEAVLTEQGVDARSWIDLEMADGATAFLRSNMRRVMRNNGVIYGTQGRIDCSMFWMCQKFKVIPRHGKSYTVKCPFEINGYEYEVRAAVRAIREGRQYCDEMPWEETLRMMRLMDGLRAEWGVVFPFEREA